MPDDMRMVGMLKDGQPAEMAVRPADFFTKPLVPVLGGALTYAQAGYTLLDYYESREPYTGPRSLAEHEALTAPKPAPRPGRGAPAVAESDGGE